MFIWDIIELGDSPKVVFVAALFPLKNKCLLALRALLVRQFIGMVQNSWPCLIIIMSDKNSSLLLELSFKLITLHCFLSYFEWAHGSCWSSSANCLTSSTWDVGLQWDNTFFCPHSKCWAVSLNCQGSLISRPCKTRSSFYMLFLYAGFWALHSLHNFVRAMSPIDMPFCHDGWHLWHLYPMSDILGLLCLWFSRGTHNGSLKGIMS